MNNNPEVPEGWYELPEAGEVIVAGDKWCVRNTTHNNEWLPSSWIGHPVMGNNRYIRQKTSYLYVPELIDSEQPVSSSPLVPQDNPTTS